MAQNFEAIIILLLLLFRKGGFSKGRGTRDQVANICWIIEKAGVPEKHLLLPY